MEYLEAFAIVSIEKMDVHNFKIERLFYKKNMEFFLNTTALA